MKSKVLLVDDRSFLTRLLSDALAAHACELALADDARQCAEKAEAGGIDLVVMVLESREEAGWKAIDEITDADPLLPVVVITTPDLKQLAEAVGAHAWVERPVNVTALVQTLQEWMDRPMAARDQVSEAADTEFGREPAEADEFRERVNQRAAAPYAFAPLYRHWGINE